MNGHEFKIRIEWPGYEPFETLVSLSPKKSEWIKGKFGFGGDEMKPYDGYWNGKTVGGFCKPYFDIREVMKILDEYHKATNGVYNLQIDLVNHLVTWRDATANDDVVAHGFYISGEWYYQIDDGLWAWENF